MVRTGRTLVAIGAGIVLLMVRAGTAPVTVKTGETSIAIRAGIALITIRTGMISRMVRALPTHWLKVKTGLGSGEAAQATTKGLGLRHSSR